MEDAEGREKRYRPTVWKSGILEQASSTSLRLPSVADTETVDAVGREAIFPVACSSHKSHTSVSWFSRLSRGGAGEPDAA